MNFLRHCVKPLMTESAKLMAARLLLPCTSPCLAAAQIAC